MQLTPGTGSVSHSHAPLPDVTIVFASVVGASSYALKRSRSDTKFLNKAIRRCMLRQLMAMPGGDGYLCRCQEADLKYMIAFENPHRAVQWCLAVQVRQVEGLTRSCGVAVWSLLADSLWVHHSMNVPLSRRPVH